MNETFERLFELAKAAAEEAVVNQTSKTPEFRKLAEFTQACKPEHVMDMCYTIKYLWTKANYDMTEYCEILDAIR